MTLSLVIYILLIHFLADFALQTHEQAIKKSTDNMFLIYHVSIYSGVWLFASTMFLDIFGAFVFAIFTFVCHFVTDWITSRINKRFFEQQNYHDGFVGVGADQFIHYVQLLLTAKLLM